MGKLGFLLKDILQNFSDTGLKTEIAKRKVLVRVLQYCQGTNALPGRQIGSHHKLSLAFHWAV